MVLLLNANSSDSDLARDRLIVVENNSDIWSDGVADFPTPVCGRVVPSFCDKSSSFSLRFWHYIKLKVNNMNQILSIKVHCKYTLPLQNHPHRLSYSNFLCAHNPPNPQGDKNQKRQERFQLFQSKIHQDRGKSLIAHLDPQWGYHGKPLRLHSWIHQNPM